MSVACCSTSWASSSAPASSMRFRVPRTCCRFSTACCNRLPLFRSAINCSRLCSVSSMVVNNSSRTKLRDVAPVTINLLNLFWLGSVGEFRFLLVHVRSHGHAQVGGLQHRAVPVGHILQAIIDPVIAHVANHVFGTANGDGGFGSNLAGRSKHA